MPYDDISKTCENNKQAIEFMTKVRHELTLTEAQGEEADDLGAMITAAQHTPPRTLPNVCRA